MGYYKQKLIEEENSSILPFNDSHQKILNLEIEIAKLKVDNKFFKNELELCKENNNAKKES